VISPGHICPGRWRCLLAASLRGFQVRHKAQHKVIDSAKQFQYAHFEISPMVDRSFLSVLYAHLSEESLPVHYRIRRRPFGTAPCVFVGAFRLEICYLWQKAGEGVQHRLHLQVKDLRPGASVRAQAPHRTRCEPRTPAQASGSVTRPDEIPP
jgi:hypothetical protein